VSFHHGVSEAADEGEVSEPSPQTPVVDLNSDLGEGFGIWTLGDDDALLDIVTSANVACGFHAGDPNILRRVCEKAVSRGVVIGAQVSYQDLAGFGRRSMDVDAATLTNDVIYQIAALDGFARVAGSKVRYVKPHGALYNRTVHDQDQAAAVVAALIAYDPSLPLLGLPGSALLHVADKAGLRTVTEAFADRGYTAQATLLPRSQPGALLHDPAGVAHRMVGMLITGRMLSVDGVEIAVSARSICVHGDTPGAVAMAVVVRKALAEAGVEIRAFAP
jgi:5-oxoprolinase (ATP-hydrolysing) subunit A